MQFKEIIRKAVVITLSDTEDNIYDGFRNGDAAAGNIAVTLTDDTTHTFANVPSGGVVMCKVKKIMASNTTVTRVEGLIFE